MRSLPLYVIGQALGYLLDITCFWIVVHIAADLPVVANIVAKAIAGTFAYFYHARVSFPGSKSKSIVESAVAFVFILIVNMAITSTLLLMLVSVAGISTYVAKLSADLFGLTVTYFWLRIVVFSRNPPQH